MTRVKSRCDNQSLAHKLSGGQAGLTSTHFPQYLPSSTPPPLHRYNTDIEYFTSPSRAPKLSRSHKGLITAGRLSPRVLKRGVLPPQSKLRSLSAKTTSIPQPWSISRSKKYASYYTPNLYCLAIKLTIGKIRTLMDKPANIRNMSVIAHGKPQFRWITVGRSLTGRLNSRSRKVHSYRFSRAARWYHFGSQSWRTTVYGHPQG